MSTVDGQSDFRRDLQRYHDRLQLEVGQFADLPRFTPPVSGLRHCTGPSRPALGTTCALASPPDSDWPALNTAFIAGERGGQEFAR